MSDLANWAEEQVINHIFRDSTMSKPSTLAVALLTTGPAETDSGQFSIGTGVEVANANGYARQVLNPDNDNWADPSGTGVTSNSSEITFPTATGSWGTVTHVAIVTSSTYDAGNLLAFAALSSSKVVDTDNEIKFSANALQFTLA